jgi:hypothetical protein
MSAHPSPILIIDSHSLEGLPFANDSFDFVHVKRIARGVPEDKVRLRFLHRTRLTLRSGTTSLKKSPV